MSNKVVWNYLICFFFTAIFALSLFIYNFAPKDNNHLLHKH